MTREPVKIFVNFYLILICSFSALEYWETSQAVSDLRVETQALHTEIQSQNENL